MSQKRISEKEETVWLTLRVEKSLRDAIRSMFSGEMLRTILRKLVKKDSHSGTIAE